MVPIGPSPFPEDKESGNAIPTSIDYISSESCDDDNELSCDEEDIIEDDDGIHCFDFER